MSTRGRILKHVSPPRINIQSNLLSLFDHIWSDSSDNSLKSRLAPGKIGAESARNRIHSAGMMVSFIVALFVLNGELH